MTQLARPWAALPPLARHHQAHRKRSNPLRPANSSPRPRVAPARSTPRDDPAAAPAEASLSSSEPPVAPLQPSQAAETPGAAPAGSSSSNGGGATPAAAEQAAAQPAKLTWQRLLSRTAAVLFANLWPLLLVHLVCDVLVFGLHRLSHRLTNEVAVKMLGAGITPEALGNMWWLSADPEIANFKTGYQLLTIVVFLLAFPLNVLLKSTASIYSVLICEGNLGAAVQRPWWRALGALRASVPIVKGLGGQVSKIWRSVFFVELLVAAAVVPLQFASLLVVTLPLTLPFILDLQAAGSAAVLEGQKGLPAIKRSQQLMKPIRWRLAVPFVGIVVALRLLDAAKGFLLSNVPPRYYKELIEIPIAIMIFGTLGSLLLTRMQDVLPYVAYKEAVLEEQHRPQEQNAATAAAKEQQQQQGEAAKQEQ